MSTLDGREPVVPAYGSDASDSGSVIAILQQARKRVDRGWITDYYAIDDAGAPVTPSAERACKWCSVGAIRCVAGTREHPAYVALSKAIYGWEPGDSRLAIIDWNDTPGRTKAEVLAAFDKAIELAGASAPSPEPATAEKKEGN